MKTILASLFVSVLSLTAFASNEHHPHPTPPPAHPTPIMLGIWHSEQPMLQNGVRIHTEFNFTHHQMTMHAICQFRGPSAHLTVGVASRANYKGNLIYVYDVVDARINDNYGRFCSAGLRPSTWEFYMHTTDLNRAVIFAPVPYQTRIPVTRVLNY